MLYVCMYVAADAVSIHYFSTISFTGSQHMKMWPVEGDADYPRAVQLMRLERYAHTYTHTYMHTAYTVYTCILPFLNKITYNVHTFIHTCIHTNIQTYRHTYIHTYMQTEKLHTYSTYFTYIKT